MRILCLLVSFCGLAQGESFSELKAIERAHEAVSAVKQRFRTALGEAIQKAGPEKSIGECRIEPPTSSSGLNAIKVGRSSHKLRNPKNSAPDWVKPFLDEYAKAKPAEIPRQKLVRLSETRVGYIEPIFIEPICLNCHGKSISEPVSKELKANYPGDQATGFAMGDFRGLLWLEADWPKAVEAQPDFDAFAVITRNCTPCHKDENQPGTKFLRKQNLSDEETLARMLLTLQKGKMPKGHETFRKTKDGKRLIEWLEAHVKNP